MFCVNLFIIQNISDNMKRIKIFPTLHTVEEAILHERRFQRLRHVDARAVLAAIRDNLKPPDATAEWVAGLLDETSESERWTLGRAPCDVHANGRTGLLDLFSEQRLKMIRIEGSKIQFERCQEQRLGSVLASKCRYTKGAVRPRGAEPRLSETIQEL